MSHDLNIDNGGNITIKEKRIWLSVFLVTIVSAISLTGIILARLEFKKEQELASKPRPALYLSRLQVDLAFDCEQKENEVGLVCSATENKKCFVYCVPVINKNDVVDRFICRGLK